MLSCTFVACDIASYMFCGVSIVLEGRFDEKEPASQSISVCIIVSRIIFQNYRVCVVVSTARANKKLTGRGIVLDRLIY